MPTCYCNDCEDKRRTDVHLTTNTNTDIRTTYSELIEEGTVIRIDGQGFYYSNANPFYDRLDGEWVGDKGDAISAKSSSITSCKETLNSCIPTYSHPPSTQKQGHNNRLPRTRHWLLTDSDIQFDNKGEPDSYIKSLIDNGWLFRLLPDN